MTGCQPTTQRVSKRRLETAILGPLQKVTKQASVQDAAQSIPTAAHIPAKGKEEK